jgi:hypothetical protein
MSASYSSLLVPITFSTLSQLKPSPNDQDRHLLEASCSQTRPSVMKSWGVSGDSSSDAGSEVEGVLIGSYDGTLYVFNQSRLTAATTVQRSHSQPSRPTSPLRLSRDSRAPSRSSTPSITSPPPFNVTPRSRIVSGVTAERVEAPKNYVDFDDEPDKLKEMLKGRNPRDKLTVSDSDQNRSILTEKPPPPSLLGPPHVGLKRKSIPKSLLSPAHSPSSTAKSFSSSSSPRDPVFPGTVHDLSLWCHIVPPRSGFGRAVTSIQFLDSSHEFLAALQETGLVVRDQFPELYF